MGRTMYEIQIKHDGLNKYRHIRGTERSVVEQKAHAQLRAWDEMWEKKKAVNFAKSERWKAAKEKEEKRSLAVTQTKEAEKALEDIESTLLFTLGIDDRIDWNKLKDFSKFNKKIPNEPQIEPIHREPQENDDKYQPRLNFLDKLFSSRKERKISEAIALFEKEHHQWLIEKEKIENLYLKEKEQHKVNLKKWEAEKEDYLKTQDEKNKAVDEQKDNYFRQLPDAIIDYCDMVLANSKYPDTFPQEYDIDYKPDTKMFVVDYILPSIDDIPKLKEVKYIQIKDEFKETFVSDSALNKIFDDLLYKIALRTIHEILEADVVSAIDSMVFNGWVNAIDKSTGKEVTNCILSVQANKEEFMNINLSNVDSKACFKILKGVSASKLHALTAIAPIIRIDRQDARFITAYGVAETLDDSINLAAMDWQDFEHLIREIFDKEFNQAGGEVKITRASRDGGVDAVAFDPDPIRGGKIVIQAKRYTNVVGVAAVRDLYGTVVNEGATKGILVTTSEYGPDAYEFARGKPLTLLNGSNLLHLLEKHGHKAKIDLKEAKKILQQTD
jgi:restriction system protein